MLSPGPTQNHGLFDDARFDLASAILHFTIILLTPIVQVYKKRNLINLPCLEKIHRPWVAATNEKGTTQAPTIKSAAAREIIKLPLGVRRDLVRAITAMLSMLPKIVHSIITNIKHALITNLYFSSSYSSTSCPTPGTDVSFVPFIFNTFPGTSTILVSAHP